MCKFRQISTELWPLIYVKISFLDSGFALILKLSFQSMSSRYSVHLY